MIKYFNICILALASMTLNAQINNSAATINESPQPINELVKFRLFPTQNMWTFIRLNTRNGRMWQLQYDVSGDNRFETYLNNEPLVTKENEVNGRFNLYPTQNIWTFILLDQIDGRTWQVQWSTEPINRGVMPIN